ncbi:structural maintenance of chromosomes protein 3 [Babesia gibsoni]|uniref:Structural maintenance of chromosomes protein n=1 Tax=Babesia gibsoni TaxID=33632 RepID=A0AAD8LJ97_BABGI|nr:structural maintenance of chromosomes protein 3 [Babesia gibsoni]
MHIDSIILDGFKSYSTRTVIGPLDPHFNAVTGLNGSGKSNVLDSLCFCLGISDLTCVRANKLDDLIYKQGQAGITKATVTVVLDNKSHPSPLPDAYRKMPEVTITRQIAIGGRNRYFLNGHPSTPKAIADFFQCARMNVNNPRFLIMQGRVTKVVNMKPKELLAMIEEASGTRIYENKRAAAVKLMQRKNQKLEEISKIMEEELVPQMKKLKNDCEDFIQWSNIKEEAERLERFDLAHRYWLAKNRSSSNAEKESNAVSEKFALQQDLDSLDDRLAELKKLLEEKRAEVEKGNKPIAEVQKSKEKVRAEIAKLECDGGLLKRDLEELQNSAKETQQEITNVKNKLKQKEQSSKKDVDNIAQLVKTLEQNKAKVADLEAALGLVTSVSSKGGEKSSGGSRQHHLKDMKSELVKMEADETALVNTIKHSEMEIQKQQKIVSEMSKEIAHFEQNKRDAEKEKDAATARLEAVKKELDRIGGMEAFEALQNKIRELGAKREKSSEMITVLEADLNRCRTRCNVPPQLGQQSTSDLRAPYYGQAFELLQLNPELGDTVSLPLHVLFGYKLYYLIARDKECGKAIFEANNLARSAKKVTVLPLNDTVVGRVVSDGDVYHCRKLVGADAKDKSVVASYMDVLTFDPKFSKLAKYIAGNALICSTSEIARKISYQQDKTKAFPTATLQGDKFDVGGSMSGGSNKGMYMVLQVSSKLRRSQNDVKVLTEEIDKLNGQLANMRKVVAQHDDVKKQLGILENNLKSITARFNSFGATTAMQKIEELKALVTEKKKEVVDIQAKNKDLTKRINDLEAEIKDWEQNRAKKEADAKEELKRLKATIKKDSSVLDKMNEAMAAVKIEQDNLQHHITTAEEELQQKEANMGTITEKMNELEEKKKQEEKKMEELEKRLAEITSQMCSSQNEMSTFHKEIDTIEKNKTNMALRLKKLEYAIQEMEKEAQESLVIMDKLVKENPWIVAEEANFNTKGSTFDFSGIRLEKITKRLNELKQLKHELSRRVNRKAQQLYDKMEGDYNDLLKKKQRVEEDRDKINSVIADLDVKKHENINRSFTVITRYFSDIFHILLSNAQATLIPINGDVLNGIEMKVGFNDTWKNSLSELSGGQRSLLALSLILAMLKVRPAPIYILDEVDAALDLSHTQNIGKMIKTQFPNSQFLIVSLKEGMFSNANVLFKTRFVDGSSTIMRHALADKQGAKKHKDN